MKILLDTCIVVDALQARRPFAQNAENIILAAASGRFDAYLTAKEMTDIYYLTHHALRSREKTEQIMSGLFSLFRILDTSAADVRQAMASVLSDFEDAVMVETALREGMDGIVTRNVNDYRKAGISIYSPEEFLNSL